MKLELKTVAIRPDGTYGALVWNNLPFAVSVECYPPILENGIYPCKRDFYHAGGYATFEIHVPGHDRVLFHKANFGRQLRGCVSLAESFAVIGKEIGIADSAGAFNEFMALTAGVDGFALVVSGR